MITQGEKPDQGSIELGPTVDLAYVDQSRDSLESKNTVWEEISNRQDIIQIDKHQIHSRAYVGRFNFKGTDQQKFVGDLSGGERNRVHLAKQLRNGANYKIIHLPEMARPLGLKTEKKTLKVPAYFFNVLLNASPDGGAFL